jgi:hypothetical protein
MKSSLFISWLWVFSLLSQKLTELDIFYNVITIRIQQAVDKYNIKHIYSIFEGSTSIYIVSADLQLIVTTIDRVIISCQVLTFGAVVDLTIGCR